MAFKKIGGIKIPLTSEDIEQEIKRAEQEDRMIDFSGKTIGAFFILNDRIRHGINFENAEIRDQFFLGDILIEGDLILKNAKIFGSVYLAKIKVGGNLNIEGLRTNGAINLVGAEIGKSLLAERVKSKGFLSLAKTDVGGDIILDKARIENTKTKFADMVVRGDLVLDGAKAVGSISIKDAQIDGLLDLDDIRIGGDLVTSGASFNGVEESRTEIGGKKIR
jgi:hypothetical protein